MPFTLIDDLPLFYELYGAKNAGSPVIFFNGWCQSARYWEQIAQNLSIKWPVLLFDSRGFGRSLPANRQFPANFKASVDEGVTEIEKLLSKFDFGLTQRKYHVVGHSLGGVTAVHFAILAQQRGQLESLTIVNSGSFDSNAKQGDTLNNFVRVLVRIKRYFDLPLIRNLVVARSVNSPIPQRYVRLIVEDLVKSDPRLAVELSFSALEDANLKRYRQEISEIEVPLLLIVGDKDATIPPVGMYNIKRFKSKSELVSFKDCGHLPMLEQPDRFAKVLAAHLRTADAMEKSG